MLTQELLTLKICLELERQHTLPLIKQFRVVMDQKH